MVGVWGVVEVVGVGVGGILPVYVIRGNHD